MIGYENDAQAYLLHRDHAHRQLNHQLAELRELFAQLGSDSNTRARLASRLHQYSDDLAKYFQDEETGGCIEEAACRCRSLSHEVSVIERQHRELKAQLAAVILAVEQEETASSADFEHFAQALDEHELLVTHFLQRGFNTANEV